MDSQADRKAELQRLGMQAGLMRELLHSPMWNCLVDMISATVTDEMDRMLSGTRDGFDYHKGRVEAFQLVLKMPAFAIQRAEMLART